MSEPNERCHTLTNANQLFRLAHEYGEAFDAAVLGRALAVASVWHRSFGSLTPQLHINVSTQSMAAPSFARRVEEALAEHQVKPTAIAFEFDGHDLASAGDRERTTVRELVRLGIPIVVDGLAGGALSLADINKWNPAMVKINADDHTPAVTAGLVRSVSALRIPTALKGIGSTAVLQTAVAVGAFAGQGNELMPVRRLERVNALLHGPDRIGF